MTDVGDRRVNLVEEHIAMRKSFGRYVEIAVAVRTADVLRVGAFTAVMLARLHASPKPPNAAQAAERRTLMASIEKTRHTAEQLGQLTGKFAQVEPAQFGSTMDDLWQSAQAIRDSVIDQVETGRITPVQGVAVVAAVTGTLFGYPEFHRELRPSDLALSLIGKSNGGQG